MNAEKSTATSTSTPTAAVTSGSDSECAAPTQECSVSITQDHCTICGVVIGAERVQYRPALHKYVAALRLVLDSPGPTFLPPARAVLMASTPEALPLVSVLGTVIKVRDVIPKVSLLPDSDGKSMLTFVCSQAEGKWVIVIVPDDTQEKRTIEFRNRYIAETTAGVDMGINSIQAARTVGEEYEFLGKLRGTSKRYVKKRLHGVMKVVDHTGKAHVCVEDERFDREFAKRVCKVGTMYLFRGCYVIDLVGREFGMLEQGNILEIPADSRIVAEYSRFFDAFCGDHTLISGDPAAETLASRLCGVELNLPLGPSTMRDVVESDDQRFRVRVKVVAVGPDDVRDWVKAYCAKCGTAFYLKASDEEEFMRCRACGSSAAKLIYQVQLFVRDLTEDSDSVYVLLIYTHNGKGAEFFDYEPPQNLHRAKRLLHRLKRMRELIIRPQVLLDCVVERTGKGKGSWLQIVNTTVTYKLVPSAGITK